MSQDFIQKEVPKKELSVKESTKIYDINKDYILKMNINQKFLDFSVDVSARRCKRF
jgi:hypothetical protein